MIEKQSKAREFVEKYSELRKEVIQTIIKTMRDNAVTEFCTLDDPSDIVDGKIYCITPDVTERFVLGSVSLSENNKNLCYKVYKEGTTDTIEDSEREQKAFTLTMDNLIDVLYKLEKGLEGKYAAKMIENYNGLSATEKLFLSEIVGDEAWFNDKANECCIINIFNGDTAPSGDVWKDACFKHTQLAIRNKVVEGTPWGNVAILLLCD